MTNEEKALAVADAVTRLSEVRPHYATLAEVLKDPWAAAQLEEIDRALGKLRREAARLELERTGAGTTPEERERTQQAAAYRAAVDHTSRIEGEFLGMLDGMLVDPVPYEAAERVAQALTTIGSKYGEHAAEHCRRLLPPGPVLSGKQATREEAPDVA
jgi:hypothetical protein